MHELVLSEVSSFLGVQSLWFKIIMVMFRGFYFLFLAIQMYRLCYNLVVSGVCISHSIPL